MATVEKTQEVEIEEYGEAAAPELVTQRRRRKEELRESILALDAELEELNRGAAIFLVDGEEGESIPAALAARREAIREELSDSHSALSHLDALKSEAEEDLEELRLEGARAAYAEARQREEKAVAKLARVVERSLVPALEGLKEVGAEVYALGLSAEMETPTVFRRRAMVVENYIATKLGEVFPLFRVHRRLQVEDLEKRLAEVLPASVSDDGRGEG